MKILKLSLAFIGLFPGVVWAQGTDEDPQAKEVIFAAKLRTDIIVTATGSNQFPEFVGQAVTVIDQDLIETRQTVSIADLLATTPGVTVSRNGSVGGFSAVRIRGAEGEQTLTLIDGVRVNDPSSPGGGFDYGNLFAGNIDRIEVLRGPNSVPWGSQAIGGVVNIVSAKPRETAEGSARAEFGSRNNTLLNGRIGHAGERLSVSLGGGYLKDRGISSFAGGSERDGYRQYGANGNAEYKLGNDVRAGISGYYANSRTQIDGFPAPSFAFADTVEFSTAKEFYGSAFVGADLFDGRLTQLVRYAVTDINRDNLDPASGPAPQFFARGRATRIEYRGEADVIPGGLRAVFGYDHERSRFTDGSPLVKTGVDGGYLQLIADPADNLTLTGGLRVDDHRSYGTKTILSGSVAYRPGYDTVIRFAYGEGFKAPTLFQLFSFFGDPNLRPESARSFDLGAEQKLFDGQITLGATLFKRKSRNQIDFDLGRFAFNNIARSRAKGAEFFATFRPSNRFAITVNYTLTDSEGRAVTAPRFSRLLRRPKHSFSTSLDWQPTERLSVGATMLTVSSSLDGFGGSIRLGGYTLIGLRGSIDVAQNISLYARVDNLFDTNYQTVANFGTFGRNAHFGVKAKF